MKHQQLWPPFWEWRCCRVRPKRPDQLLINGAGATFPYPIYSKWAVEYSKVDPSVRINYQSIGSGGGQNPFRRDG